MFECVRSGGAGISGGRETALEAGYGGGMVTVTDRQRMTILSPYMEAVGTLAGLVEQDGVLLAEIARHVVVLPIVLKDELAPHVGRRIAVLRTDIPGREYMIRVISGNLGRAVEREELGDDVRGMCCMIVIPHAVTSEEGSIC